MRARDDVAPRARAHHFHSDGTWVVFVDAGRGWLGRTAGWIAHLRERRASRRSSTFRTRYRCWTRLRRRWILSGEGDVFVRASRCDSSFVCDTGSNSSRYCRLDRFFALGFGLIAAPLHAGRGLRVACSWTSSFRRARSPRRSRRASSARIFSPIPRHGSCCAMAFRRRSTTRWSCGGKRDCSTTSKDRRSGRCSFSTIRRRRSIARFDEMGSQLEDFGGYATLTSAEEPLSRPYRVPLRPRAAGWPLLLQRVPRHLDAGRERSRRAAAVAAR